MMLAACAAALGAIADVESLPATSQIATVESLAANENPTWPWDHDHWAVLIAGSSGYGNYRHQADVCHAYQIIKKQGVNPAHIIVLAVDDIAGNEENPFPGQMFNKPTEAGTPGVDVYDGCMIDYSGKDVTPDTFTKVLTGDAASLAGVGTGKVLKSTHKSRVFINFVDHGGVNIIGFPRTTMHAKDLVGALTTMHSKQMYKELVFYLEACESGSMFQTLPKDINIYATTAANARESSWGFYCPPHDKVNGQSLHSCLGDLYSINWMEDSDTNIKNGESLAAQFDRVKQETNKSHVMEFGDLDIASTEPTSNFQGKTDKVNAAGGNGAQQPVRRVVDARGKSSAGESTALPSADAEMASAYARFVNTDSKVAALELIASIQDRLASKERFEKISLAVTGKAPSGVHTENTYLDCHYAAYQAHIAHCGEWSVQALKHSADLAEMCAHTRGDARPIVAAIHETCTK